jgi:hypothetical protein
MEYRAGICGYRLVILKVVEIGVYRIHIHVL